MLFESIVSRPRAGWSRQGYSSGYPLQSLLQCFQCLRQDEHISFGDLGSAVPPFGCSFSTAPDMHQVLVVANEEGVVRLYDTECQDVQRQIVKEWMAHTNAIFDIAWVPGEHKLVTASGDQTAKLWDVKAGELIGVCKGHQCSVKSVAFSKFEKAVFCTGGRDGNIMLWDTRCNKKDGFYRQVNQILGAHNALDKQTPSKMKKRKPAAKGLAPPVDSQQSVTVVIFQDEHTLISAGAVDGVVKMWDLRKNYSSYRQDPLPVKMFPYAGSSTRKLGYSSLVLDSTGTNLFANCTDDNIYMFNVTGLKSDPVSIFSGHENSTFYVKSSISPDGQFLLSGSSDHNAFIWQVSEPQAPPVKLLGHSQEVTSVAWCPSDFAKIATCSDDNTVRIWRMNRSSDDTSGGDRTNLVGWTCQKKCVEALVAVKHCTPGKPTRKRNSFLMSSPILAACAPSNNGDLPMPSSTPTGSAWMVVASLQTPTTPKAEVTATSPKQLSTTKISIKDWVTRTPKSCTTEKDTTPSPRKAFTPMEQYTTVSSSRVPSQFEKRAKRRLETSSEDVEHQCLNSCNCVVALEPGFKKARLDLCSVEEQDRNINRCLSLADLSKCEKETTACTERNSSTNKNAPLLGSPCDVRNECFGKENSSPDKNWLSALGYKLKGDKSCTQNKVGSSFSPRNGSAKKHQAKSVTSSPSVPTTPVSMRKICTYFHKKASE